MQPVENVQPTQPEDCPSTAKSRRSHISRVDEYHDVRTLSTKLRKTHANKATETRSRKHKIGLRVIRKIDRHGQYERTVVEIRSDQLFKLMLDLHQDTQRWVEQSAPPIVNPKLFYFSLSGLEKRLLVEQERAHPDNELISNIKAAVQFTHEDYDSTTDDLKKQVDAGQISFDLLWALLHPALLVFRREPLLGQNEILSVRRLRYGRSQAGQFAHITCDVIRDDGVSFGLAEVSIQIDEFPGLRPIQDLDVYPLHIHPQHAEIRNMAIAQAHRFIHVTPDTPILLETQGLAILEKTNSFLQTKTEKFFVTRSRVMIDPVAFGLYNPNCSYNTHVHTYLDRNSLTDEQCAIFSPVLLGFCFGSKTWGGFAAERLFKFSWSVEAFGSLVLGEKQKKLILALTKQHIISNAAKSDAAKSDATFDDIIPGKGRGLVGLLCGGPGCGKTLTAEAIAEYTHSPLYAVSAGELGTEPEKVDNSLSRALELAERWNAVLLLDEADVFLQARAGVNDLNRNALVSIFLRQLEYYKGVLILTTNLIAHIDTAFESRIHFCIHYPDLGMEARRKIWHMFFHKVLKEEGMKAISTKNFNKLVHLEMNGRQIKNAVSSAQSIALQDNVSLSVEHVERVLDVANDWKAAMKQEHPGPIRPQTQEYPMPIQTTRTYYLSNYGILTVVLSFLAVVFSFSILRNT